VEGQLVFTIPTFTLNPSPGTFAFVTGTTPFSGELSVFLGDFTNTQGQVFSVDLSGTAQYSMSFFPPEVFGGTTLALEEADFKFEGTANPVPEPATLLLVGAGLAGCAWRTRTRRPVC
jgi:PEP-CTERM motif